MTNTQPRPIDALIGATWREHYVHANGVRQHIWRTGGGGPVVVALPGFQEIGLTWARVARRLEHVFDLIMVDFRAQGRTERGTAAYSQALLVDDVAALLDGLGVTHASVLGFSNGAGVAAELAATHGALVACAVLEDPPRNSGRPAAMTESPQYRAWHATWLEWIDHFQSLPADEQVGEIQSRIPTGGTGWPNDEIIAFAESYAQLDVELVRDPGPLWQVANRSTTTLLAEITCPVLLMESGRPISGAPPSSLPPAANTPPNVTRIKFETGHFIRREQFDRYMAFVEAFLREHARTGPSDSQAPS